MRRTGIAAFLLCAAVTAEAAETRTVALVAGDGSRVEIAELTVEGTEYSLDWNAAVFEDHFLSMRPFRCVPGGGKLWCHVPYPYAIRRDIGGDLTDLEYDLLFVWKDETDYGIDMWNGVYYRLTDQGAAITGEMREMDMGGLAVPPPDGELRPIRPGDLHEADPASHAFPAIVIE